MKWNITYFENDFFTSNEHIQTIEIENKATFYRFIKDLTQFANKEIIDDIKIFNEENKEITSNINLSVIIDYFDIDFNSKKNINESTRLIKSNIDEIQYQELLKEHKKMKKILDKILSNIELPISINDDMDFDALLKNMKLAINSDNVLINNLLLLIDINKILNYNKTLVFVNLKQYLSQDELCEFYKYAIYNATSIILVDSQCYGPTLEYEKKIIIDSNLDEFLL